MRSAINLYLLCCLPFLMMAGGCSTTSPKNSRCLASADSLDLEHENICQDYLEDKERKTESPKPNTQALKKMSELPLLQEFVAQALNDPELPQALKLVLKRGLANSTLAIKKLDQKLRDAWKIDARANGAAFDINHITGFSYEGESSSLNQEISNQINPHQNFDSLPTIVIPDRDADSLINPELILVHELAHTVFDPIFKKVLLRWKKKLPRSLVMHFRNEYQTRIHEQLLCLLTEVYAHSSERNLAINQASQKYFSQKGLRWQASDSGQPTQHVIGIYKITNPFVLDLAQLSVHEILLGGKKLAADQKLLEDTFETPILRASKFHTALYQFRYALLARLLNATQQTKSGLLGRGLKKPISMLLLDAINENRLGKTNVLELFSQILNRYFLFAKSEDDQAICNEFLAFLAENRDVLKEQWQWQLPPTGAISEQTLIDSFPDIEAQRSLVRQEIKRLSHTKLGRMQLNVLNAILDDYLLLNQITKEEANSFFARDATEKTMLHYLGKISDLDLPLNEIAHNQNWVYHNFNSEKFLIKFWKRLGLIEQFQKLFKQPLQIWQSKMSLIKLIEFLESNKAQDLKK